MKISGMLFLIALAFVGVHCAGANRVQSIPRTPWGGYPSPASYDAGHCRSRRSPRPV